LRIESLVTASFALLVLVTAEPASAQFNKCKGSDGKIAYTDGPCPKGSKSDRKFNPDEAVPIGPLSETDRGFQAPMCLTRWREEVSPQARAQMAATLYARAESGGQRVRDNLRRAGLTLEQAVKVEIDEKFVKTFETDCLGLGFRRVGPATDRYNENVSRALQRAVDQSPSQSGSRPRPSLTVPITSDHRIISVPPPAPPPSR
jgi:hypothetical protein